MAAERDTLRAALEEAYDKQEREPTAPATAPESGGSEEDTSKQVRDSASTEKSEPGKSADKGESGEDESGVKTPSAEEQQKEPEAKKEPPPEKKQEDQSSNIGRAPDSWKPEIRAQWDKVPNEVRAEIYRREREIVQSLQQTYNERKLAHDFQQTVYPFEVFMRAENVHPLQAVRELLGQAALLRVGTPAQKAKLVANVVKQFNVPIADLDSALVGEEIPDEEGKLSRIIQQQLAPVNQFMQQIGQLRQERVQRTETEIDQDIDKFASDPKNEYFYEVSNEMADLMEMAARNGQQMTLAQAYTKACQYNDEVQKKIAAKRTSDLQKKKDAGSSLPSRGAPPAGGDGKDDSVRGSILAAMEAASGR